MTSYETLLVKRFREAVEAEIAKAEKIVASGTCADFEAYKAKCGEIKGLRNALTILTEECQIINKEGP